MLQSKTNHLKLLFASASIRLLNSSVKISTVTSEQSLKDVFLLKCPHDAFIYFVMCIQKGLFELDVFMFASLFLCEALHIWGLFTVIAHFLR